jgi:hypothetical protein
MLRLHWSLKVDQATVDEQFGVGGMGRVGGELERGRGDFDGGPGTAERKAGLGALDEVVLLGRGEAAFVEGRSSLAMAAERRRRLRARGQVRAIGSSREKFTEQLSQAREIVAHRGTANIDAGRGSGDDPGFVDGNRRAHQLGQGVLRIRVHAFGL